MRIVVPILASLVLAASLGCASHYQIHDPTTDQDYYTRKFDRQRSGSVVFYDAKTGRKITLQNSEIQKVSKDVYQGRVAN